MTRMIVLAASLVLLLTSAVFAKSSSDMLGGTTTKSKSSSGVINKSSGTKSGNVQPGSLSGAKSQSKPKKAKATVGGQSKKGATDPLSGKSGSKAR